MPKRKVRKDKVINEPTLTVRIRRDVAMRAKMLALQRGVTIYEVLNKILDRRLPNPEA